MTEPQRITTVEGTALPMRGNDIDTDRIMPARFLRAVTFDGLEQHLFEDERTGSAAGDRAQAAVHPFDDPRFAGASLLLVNRNFGCGSSREHAPQGLRRAGIRAVIGESFSEIFFGNALIIGLPCVTATPEMVQMLMQRVEAHPDAVLRLDLGAGTCTVGDVSCAIDVPAYARDALITGAWDTTSLLLERYEEVDAASARLPYVGDWSA
ncbi:MAG: 3-isopropylmalate dehydratase small subunit [Acidobacteria bacterium]|nr:3-isopropylmalate dehydratase small subunit [Acidobacteriota bacterium]